VSWQNHLKIFDRFWKWICQIFAFFGCAELIDDTDVDVSMSIDTSFTTISPDEINNDTFFDRNNEKEDLAMYRKKDR